MKTFLIMLASVLFFIQSSSFVLGEEPSVGDSISAERSSDSSKSKRQAPKLDIWDGTLEKMDAEARAFVVSGKEFKSGKRSIKVFVDDLEKTWAELKIGDKVRVAYFPRKEGVCIAKKISKGGLSAAIPK